MKAFTIKPKAKVFVYDEPVRMSCSFPGLSKLVQQKLGKKPESGDLFLFMNKKSTYLKVLFWAKHGPCIFAKSLPRGFFPELHVVGQSLSIGELHKIADHVLFKKSLPKQLDLEHQNGN